MSREAIPHCPISGKEMYVSPALAHQIVRRMNGHRRGSKMNVYRCNACHRWHIGHEISTHKNQRMRRR